MTAFWDLVVQIEWFIKGMYFGVKTMMARRIKLPPRPWTFDNIPMEYGIEHISLQFDWRKFKFRGRWKVTEGIPGLNVGCNLYYFFKSEQEAIEFVMLKKLEQ